MEFDQLKKELQTAVEQAENIAIDALAATGNFVPFIYRGEKKLERILADSLDEAVEAATEAIEGMDEGTVVFTYKDHIRLNDGSFDGIVCQVYSRNEDSAYAFGLLYRVAEGKMQFLNKRLFLGNIRNCLVF